LTSTVYNDEDESTKGATLLPPIRQIPVRYPPMASLVSTVNGRPASATNLLQKQNSDLLDVSSSTSLLNTSGLSHVSANVGSASPRRRAEVAAREAIEDIARLQHQQRNQTLATSNNQQRSPSSSRRVIINLQNNQSGLVDGRHSSIMKPPAATTTRCLQTNNLYYIPVLHEIQMPSTTSETSRGKFKNEFHIEIPVTITTNNDQENFDRQGNGCARRASHRDYTSSLISQNSNPSLKSILKRSSSRDTVLRKNVSFLNV
jgi:hypothetical protein